MKKTVLTVSVVATMFLAGCTANSETPTPVPPSNTVRPSATFSPAPSATPRPPSPSPVSPPEGGGGEAVEPTANVPTSEAPAEPPATQFLKRWGNLYPGIAEASIAGAAARSCKVANAAGENWVSNVEVANDVKAILTDTGFTEVTTATANDFTADALERFCS